MKNFLIICFSFFLVSGTALADVQITIKGDKGRTSTFSSDGKMARIEDKQMPGYVIIDHASGDFYMVDTQRGEIMKTSMGKGGVVANDSKISVKLKDKGDGPKIAGYSTRKYELIANGESCGTIYASRKLLKNKNVHALFESMRSMQQHTRSMRGGMSGMMSVCDQANMQQADVIESSGVPMRMIDQNGKLESEVLAVDTNKKFAASHYALPSGMKVIDMSDKMNQATQETQQMMEDMPDMGELMKQIQQGGGQMTEEMQQQMEKMQEKMKQLQQQSQ
jgi:hypothetical protein